MFNAKAAHSRYTAKNALNKASTDITLKRKLEKEVDIQYNKDARLIDIKEQEDILEQNEEDLKKTKDKALLKMKEAQELMEKAQKMDKLIADKKKDMEKSEIK